MSFLMKLPNKFIFLLISCLISIKFILYLFVRNGFLAISFSGGNDADYYHAYAIGYEDFSVNIWPEILRFFNDFGLYSREWVSYFLLFLNLFIIPFLTAKLSNLNFNFNQKYYLYIFLLCSIYPTLFFYSFDVYRDVFMLFVFLVGCFVVKKSLSSNNLILFLFFYILAFLIALFLTKLRPYLGYAFLIALFFWKIKLSKKRLIFLTILYFLTLFTLNHLGFFEGLTEYREGFEDNGGSTLGLDFSNPVMFIPNFLLSFLGQFFGLYITNYLAVVLFVLETIPILFMLLFIVRNIRYADNFVRFLIVFFVAYASVWLIGNDNLGTAIRLRVYNYFVIYICFFYILSLKVMIKDQKVINK